MLPHVAPLLLLACVRFEGLPDMPPGTAADPIIYASQSKQFSSRVGEARLLVRSANISWVLRGTAGEVFASSREIRERFGGIIFVGDSQIREIAWAALQMLTHRQPKRYSKTDRVFGGTRRPLGDSACVPQTIGKTGFTASCGVEGSAAGASAEPCSIHSPFHNKSHAEKMRKLLLTKPHLWDGKLSVSESVCDSEFFLSYQATWGAMPIDPTTLPKCLHPPAGAAEYSLPHKRLGVRKPVLWIIDGCGLHEMEFCDARRWTLPQSVLPKFSDALLASGTVVYQTVGAGFLMKAARRFRGDCADVTSDQVARTEVAWLDQKRVRRYNYTSLALQYAPLMFDAIHYTCALVTSQAPLLHHRHRPPFSPSIHLHHGIHPAPYHPQLSLSPISASCAARRVWQILLGPVLVHLPRASSARRPVGLSAGSRPSRRRLPARHPHRPPRD
jgi:hypothetical protein